MKITILGSGDAFGTGGRFNSCLHVEAAGQRMLVDCGSSGMVTLNKAGIERNGLSTLLFTHFHGDHFGGLPAIPSIYQLNQSVTGNTLNVTLGTRSNN